MNLTITSKNSEQTRRLGEQLGQRCTGGEVIELIGDLGSGKTTFVQGLAKGIDSSDHVASPTFTISRLYQGPKLEIHHFDFYRLQDAGLMEYELHDVIGEPNGVIVVEWGQVVSHILPKKRLTVRLSQAGDEARQFELHSPRDLEYLVKDLK